MLFIFYTNKINNKIFNIVCFKKIFYNFYVTVYYIYFGRKSEYVFIIYSNKKKHPIEQKNHKVVAQLYRDCQVLLTFSIRFSRASLVWL